MGAQCWGAEQPYWNLSAKFGKALAFLFALESGVEQDVAGMRPVRRNGENTVETLWKEKGVILNDSIPCQTKTGESGESGNALIASEFVDFKGVASHEASRGSSSLRPAGCGLLRRPAWGGTEGVEFHGAGGPWNRQTRGQPHS